LKITAEKYLTLHSALARPAVPEPHLAASPC
jgi:hypothetical protein